LAATVFPGWATFFLLSVGLTFGEAAGFLRALGADFFGGAFLGADFFAAGFLAFFAIRDGEKDYPEITRAKHETNLG
jgi:glutathione S-transferase